MGKWKGERCEREVAGRPTRLGGSLAGSLELVAAERTDRASMHAQLAAASVRTPGKAGEKEEEHIAFFASIASNRVLPIRASVYSFGSSRWER